MAPVYCAAGKSCNLFREQRLGEGDDLLVSGSAQVVCEGYKKPEDRLKGP